MLVPLSFERFGLAEPTSPIVLSVPHAGRDYPLELRAALRVPLAHLLPLEDRHADALALGAREGETCFVQRRARAWIDLNRAESERDPKLDDGASPQGHGLASAKLRSGLGLVPRRAGRSGDIYRRRLSGEEVMARIASDHRPYHLAIQAALEAARARFGVAVLVDVHSMPPLGTGEPQVVLGDRFGKSAASRFVMRAEAALEARGLRYALNAPYSGGHILERQCRPERGIHGLQIEFDRSLYLDRALEAPGKGLAHTVSALRDILDSLADEALGAPQLLAAE